MITPTSRSIGRRVLYQAYPGRSIEVGTVTSVNDEFVFVRYDNQHARANGKATKNSQLSWLLTPRRVPRGQGTA